MLKRYGARATKLLIVGSAGIGGKVAKNHEIQKIIFNAIRLDRPEFHKFWTKDDIRFLAYVFANRALSRSQILQDLWVCFELNEKRSGFFVEFGATNGCTNSNTWLLEKILGWTGILAEPNPFWHAELAVNRHVPVEHRCVSARSGETVTFLATDNSDPELSAIASFSGGDHAAALRSRGRKMEVETISLNDLLTEHRAPAEIDYLSVDTEGSELHILSAFDFSKFRFQVISVEQNPTTRAGLCELLARHGYIRVFPQFSQWDGWYVAQELRHKPLPEIVAPRA